MVGSIHFIKMHGAGNDYVYVDCFEQFIADPGAFSKNVSKAHFGIGSDGAIFIRRSKNADCFMDIYNSDGSRAVMCGNGLRCTAMYLWEKCGKCRNIFNIETLSGIHRAEVFEKDKNRCYVSVSVGHAFFRNAEIPRRDIGRMLPGGVFLEHCAVVDTGNLHCVLKLKSENNVQKAADILKSVELRKIGSYLEVCEEFPKGVNTEICMADDEVCGPYKENLCIRARVWERGSGETLACGSGACAIYKACTQWDLQRRTRCCVLMPGGRLSVSQKDDEIILSGDAVKVFEGELS